MVNDEWGGGQALENAFRVADEELRKVERERDQARRERDKWEEKYLDTDESLHKARDERDQYKRSGDEWKECHADAVRERDEWKARAEAAEGERDHARATVASLCERLAECSARAEAAEARTAPDVTRNEVWRIVAAHDPGDDEMALSRANRLTDAVCDLFGVEAEPADPIEDKARELHEVAQGDGPFIVWEALMDVVRNRYRRMAAHVLGQEADR